MSDGFSPDVLQLQKRLLRAEQHVLAAEQRADHADVEVARTKAINADLEARNALLELQNAKMRTVIFGQSSERSVRIIDQMELSFEELEASASEDEATAAEAAKRTNVVAFERKRPSRKPLPEHLPRERVIIAAPTEWTCNGFVPVT
jgi:hypothetical protein